MTIPAQIRSVSFAGAGNLATHLAIAFQQKGIHIRKIYSPTPAHAQELAQRVSASAATEIKELGSDADLVFLCIKDDAIKDVAAALASSGIPLVHTSGSVPIDVFAGHASASGVFYPVQSFRRERPVQWNEIPICIEAGDPAFQSSLVQLAELLSSQVTVLTSEQRKWLHLSAVMVSNFSNLLYIRAEKLLEQKQLDFSLLRSLISETALRLQTASPREMQTGPARRDDRSVIENHERMLADQPEMLQLYRLLTEMIRDEFNSPE